MPSPERETNFAQFPLVCMFPGVWDENDPSSNPMEGKDEYVHLHANREQVFHNAISNW